MPTGRFKIDFTQSSYHPFGLYFRRSWLGVIPRWVEVQTFKTRDEALEHYELIKTLPEYLA